MKAITIQQPYAWLIMQGLKQFETRTWNTKHRGGLAIHAGAKYNHEGMQNQAIRQVLSIHQPNLCPGAILGIVELVDTVRMTPELIMNMGYFEKEAGHWQPGNFAWRLRVVEVYAEPIAAKGKLGLWDWKQPE